MPGNIYNQPGSTNERFAEINNTYSDLLANMLTCQLGIVTDRNQVMYMNHLGNPFILPTVNSGTYKNIPRFDSNLNLSNSNLVDVTNGVSVTRTVSGETYISLCDGSTEKVYLKKEDTSNDFLIYLAVPGICIRIASDTGAVRIPKDVYLTQFTQEGFIKNNASGLLSSGTLQIGDIPAHNLLSATHGDTTVASVTRGDLLIGQGSTPKWARFALGAFGKFLKSDGTDVVWGDLPTDPTFNSVTIDCAIGNAYPLIVNKYTLGEVGESVQNRVLEVDDEMNTNVYLTSSAFNVLINDGSSPIFNIPYATRQVYINVPWQNTKRQSVLTLNAGNGSNHDADHGPGLNFYVNDVYQQGSMATIYGMTADDTGNPKGYLLFTVNNGSGAESDELKIGYHLTDVKQSLKLSAYGAGFLKTDASGNVTAGTIGSGDLPTHALAGSAHSSDTITNLNLKLTDGSLITTKAGEINALTDLYGLGEVTTSDSLIVESSYHSWAKYKLTIEELCQSVGLLKASDAIYSLPNLGDIITGQSPGPSPQWKALAAGTNGYFLKMVTGEPAWSQEPTILNGTGSPPSPTGIAPGTIYVQYT